MNAAEAEELFFDALESADYGGYSHRGSGIVDMQAADIVKALLAAGWTPPGQLKSNPEGATRWVKGQLVLYHPTDPHGAAKSATVLAVDGTRGIQIRMTETGIETYVSAWHLAEYPNAPSPAVDEP